MANIKYNDDDEGSETWKVYGEVLAKCHDFQNELTSHQELAQTLCSMADQSTKSHPRFAGEGIEYSWDVPNVITDQQSSKTKRKKIILLTL